MPSPITQVIGVGAAAATTPKNTGNSQGMSVSAGQAASQIIRQNKGSKTSTKPATSRSVEKGERYRETGRKKQRNNKHKTSDHSEDSTSGSIDILA